MKVSHLLLAALTIAAPLTMNSCSVVSQVRSVDLSKIPVLNKVAEAQKDMMDQYGASARLLLQSRLAALEALALDAEAYADADKASQAYDVAVTIAKEARAKMEGVKAELTNIQNSPDMDAVSKAVTNTADADTMVQEGYTKLGTIANSGNAAVTAQNAKGDKLVLTAVHHVEAANVKIAESYGLLQDAQLTELKLVAVAAAQSAALIKGLESADTVQKVGLAITFRPIVYFLTGLPDEIKGQNAIKAMWEDHAKQVAGLKLPSRKQLPDLKSDTKQIAKGIQQAITSTASGSGSSSGSLLKSIF